MMSNTSSISRSKRLVLPAMVMILTALGGLIVFAGGSSGASNSSPVLIASTVSNANNQITPPAAYQTGRANSGAANSSSTVYANGHLAAYGNKYIAYIAPPQVTDGIGQALYMQNCASCHGTKADGVPANGTPGAYPNLIGLGPATIDFWIETGRMPAADPTNVQAATRAPRLNSNQSVAISGYINSLSPATPYIPKVRDITGADKANGFSLFALNCAACHTITGGGDMLAKNTYAPSLRLAQPTQIVEAIRTGPGNMPRFTGNLTDKQVRDIAYYVNSNIQHPVNNGGIGLGGLGPVAEGFVAMLFGIGALLLVAFWIGERN